MTENFIDKSPTRTKCLAYPAANQDPVARPSRGWPVQGIAQAIGAVAQGAARATMTTANGVRGQLRGAGGLADIAAQLGLPQEQVAGQLAQLLPQVIDGLTPNGQVPDAGADLLGQGLSALGGLLGKA